MTCTQIEYRMQWSAVTSSLHVRHTSNTINTQYSQMTGERGRGKEREGGRGRGRETKREGGREGGREGERERKREGERRESARCQKKCVTVGNN